MKKLTDKELTIMEVLWEHGEQSIRGLISLLPDAAAHFNTIATYVRRLEMHGMICHKELSVKFYLYDAAVTREQYINSIRLEEALHLLRDEPTKTISAIAAEVGFTPANLREQFKRKYGVTPGEYRQNL